MEGELGDLLECCRGRGMISGLATGDRGYLTGSGDVPVGKDEVDNVTAVLCAAPVERRLDEAGCEERPEKVLGTRG
jgi:hypothetical protein